MSALRAESAQTRPFSYYFLSVAERQKNVYRGGGGEIVREEENKDRWIKRNGEKREEGELLEPRRGHGVPAERNSGKHP